MADAASSGPDRDEPADSEVDRADPRLRVRFVVEGCELLVLGTTGTPALLSARRLASIVKR
jgi:hypothetical protein